MLRDARFMAVLAAALAAGMFAATAAAATEEPDTASAPFRLRVQASVVEVPLPGSEMPQREPLRFRGPGAARLLDRAVGLRIGTLDQVPDGEATVSIEFHQPLPIREGRVFAGRARATLRSGDVETVFPLWVVGEVRRARDGRLYLAGRFHGADPANPQLRIRGRFRGPQVQAERPVPPPADPGTAG